LPPHAIAASDVIRGSCHKIIILQAGALYEPSVLAVFLRLTLLKPHPERHEQIA